MSFLNPADVDVETPVYDAGAVFATTDARDRPCETVAYARRSGGGGGGAPLS